MDWLDELIVKLNIKATNLSLRKSIVFYMMSFIIIIVSVSAATFFLCYKWDEVIWAKYNQPTPMNHPMEYVIIYENYAVLSDADRFQVEIIDFLQTWSVFLYSLGGIMGSSYLFYKNKLKKPLAILKEAADQIGHNNLDIEIGYPINDEMGDLCNSFDQMRKQLIANNQKMWDLMEEQKRLNAAFAHDLRTPLTVLKGYTDFLTQYVPQGKVNEEKLISTLTLLSNNLERLERYSNTMKEINSLEEIPVHQFHSNFILLQGKLKELISIMDGSHGIRVTLAEEEVKSDSGIHYQEEVETKSGIHYSEEAEMNSGILYQEEVETKSGTHYSEEVQSKSEILYLDEAIIMEVCENLLSNAMRYAKTSVKVALVVDVETGLLLISVTDDGKGFTQRDLTMATKPYYSDDKEDKSHHFGIGLYICKILCEKHGGSIALSNSVDRGAIVTASFSYINLS
ncbi:MAG: putative two-component sensor histidine kinase [Herbinix sp.]|jgi:signal transduction histidine kinase|nr:putative two-component sensor histidine kinase [Herbinix sp.]